jgi:eukaryotic-like serine/threonine-protein kinase
VKVGESADEQPWPAQGRSAILEDTRVASAGASLRSGDQLGSYQLLLPIGAGGMGRVWVARELNAPGRARLVAVKTALAEDGATEGFYKVLFDEARIASLLTHPNVCTIHGAERDRGVVYLTMDYSDGGSLRELLDAMPEHRIDVPMAVRVVARVCSGLHAAHELLGEDGEPLHVVHRDVSPQNVLVSTTGQVRLTDFGVAKARGQVHAPTQTGEVKGKLSYMAPEQVTTKDIDRRADIFALGCVLYEATVGERPYAGGDALATLYQLLEEPLTPPSVKRPGYPPELEKIVMRAMARERDERFATAEEFGRALERFLLSEKAMVSDARVAELVKATLADSISRRSTAIADAIRAIEDEKTRPTLGSSPSIESPAPPAPEVMSPPAIGPSGPTLSGTSLAGLRPSRSSRVVVLAAGAALAVGAGVFALTRPSPTPGAASVTPVPAVTAPPTTPDGTPSAAPPTTASAPVPDATAPPHASATTVATTGKRPPFVRKPPPPPAASAPKPVETAKPPGRPIRTLDADNPFARKEK